MSDVHLHPLTAEELAEVKIAVRALIDVLPPGDDERGKARALLMSASEKLDRHWCAWCPSEIRDLSAVAYNAVVNQGSGRFLRKMGDLQRAVNRYRPPVEEHFRAINEFEARQPRCSQLEGCEIRPGGAFHNAECAVEKTRRA